jgi:transposase
MPLLPVADAARLLGIHPKTLCHWLKVAHLPLAPHPTDARSRCVAQEALLEVASLHSRPLPDLSAGVILEKDLVSGGAAGSTAGAPSASLADVLQQLSQVQAHVATLQHHLVRLTLQLLQERTGDPEQRLQTLQALVSQPLASVQPLQFQQTTMASPSPPSPLPEHRLLPAEVRARSRVTALIEYGAQGQYVTVCPRQGVLSLVPDSPEWFDWLASLTAFRFVGPPGRFSACRASEKGQYTRRWAARRFFHGHDFWHYLGVTDRLTLASLEQAAAALQARVDAL